MHDTVSTGPCPNCGAELHGRFCANCGQRVAPLRPTLHELLHEATHELSHVDGKILRTVGLLLFRPGQLTKEFFEGKRARSVTPIRLYLLASVLFFGIVALSPPRPMKVSVTKGTSARLERAAERMNRDPTVLAHAMETAFPKAMFLLMPLFGLIVYAFYSRTERMYVPHFYFSVHVHAFAFVAFTVNEAIRFLHWAPLRYVRFLFLLAPVVYLPIALRTVYGGGRLLTAGKTIAILALDLLFVVLTMAGIALVLLMKFR